MDRVRELVRLHRKGRTTREVARLLGMSPNTERKFRQRLEGAGLLRGDPEVLPTLEELRVVVAAPKSPEHERSSLETWVPRIEALISEGHRPTAIHEILGRDPRFNGSLSAVKRAYGRLKARAPKPEDVAIPVVTAPGDVAQVDFGQVAPLIDPASGTSRKAWVFVMTLGCSRHMFAKVVFDQTVDTWLQLHIEAFSFFQGVPKTLVPDNLKAAVVKAAFGSDELSGLNRSYRELARYYGFVIDPAPPFSPEKKGKVERSVRYVKDAFFGRRDLADVQVANTELRTWLVDKAGMRVHGTTGRRPMEDFEATERVALKALPARPYVPAVWKHVTVGNNAHVVFDKAFWSVPWTLLGQRVVVRATPAQVEVYADDRQVAAHPRLPAARWHTVEAHLPEGRRDLRHRSREHWEERADNVSDRVGAFIRAVFDHDDVSYPLRRVASMLRALEAVTPERAAAACERAAFFGNYSAAGLKRILDKGLDTEPLPGGALTPAWATTPQFARSAESFLQNLAVGGSHGRC